MLFQFGLRNRSLHISLQTLLTGGIAPSQEKGKGKETAKSKARTRSADGSEDESETDKPTGAWGPYTLVICAHPTSSSTLNQEDPLTA